MQNPNYHIKAVLCPTSIAHVPWIVKGECYNYGKITYKSKWHRNGV